MTTINLLLLCLLLALQAGDIFTTLKVLDQGGREVWPTTKWLMQRIGVVPALAVGKGGLAFMAVWLSFYEQADVFVAVVPTWWLLAALCAPYGYVVWRNWGQMRIAEGKA